MGLWRTAKSRACNEPLTGIGRRTFLLLESTNHFFLVLPRTAMPCVVPPCTSCRLMIEDSKKGTLLCFASWCICAARTHCLRDILHPPALHILQRLLKQPNQAQQQVLGKQL